MADWVEVATGGSVDLVNFSDYENLIPEGDLFKVHFNCRLPVDAVVAQDVENQMIAQGVPQADAVASGNTLIVTAQKGFPWLAVIAAIILATLVLVIILVSWSIFKKIVPPALQSWIVPVLLVGAAILLIGPGIKNTRGQ